MDKSFKEIVDLLVRQRAEDGVHKRLQNAPGDNTITQACNLEAKYKSLDLKAEDREVIDALLEVRLQSSIDQLVRAYMTGVEDCYNILTKLNINI